MAANTNEEYRERLYNNFSLRETEDLLEIYQHGTLDDLDDSAFGVIQQILRERCVTIPEPSVHLQVSLLTCEALSLADEEDWQVMLEHAERIVELQPLNALGYTLRGRALIELDQLDQALLNLQTSLHLNPDQPDVWEEWLGVMDAMSELDEVRTRECDFDESPACLQLDAALGLIQEYRIEEALTEIESARANLPEIALAYNYLGQIYEEMDRVEPAIAAYRQAIHCNPRFYAARENMANARIRWEAEQYRQAALMEPTDEELPEYSPDDWQAAPDHTLPEWFYLDETAFWLRGWPGNRSRSGRIGLDPLDTDFEQAHIQGVVLRKLFTGRFRTLDAFDFLILMLLDIYFLFPFVFFLGNAQDKVFALVISNLSFYPIIGISILINLIRSFITVPTDDEEENGRLFY